MRPVLLMILAACGGSSARTKQASEPDPVAACNALPADAQRIEVRPFLVPHPCALESAAAIVDDASLHAALVVPSTRAPCSAPIAAVDFTRDRLDSFTLEANQAPPVTWVAIRDGATLARVVMPVKCGGMSPGRFQMWMVVPKDAPPVALDLCTIGGCSGPPRP